MRFAVEDGVQIRRHRPPRVDIAVPVTLRPQGHDEAWSGVTVNLAAEGLLVTADLEVNTGDIVDISLELAGPQEPMNVSGTVVRHAEGMIAFSFLKHSRAIRSRLTALVGQRQLNATRSPA